MEHAISLAVSMSMKVIFTFILLLLAPLLAVRAQSALILSGYVQDAHSGERLPMAKIYEKTQQQGTLANHYGFFQLGLLPGKVELIVSYAAYAPQTLQLYLTQDSSMQINLRPYLLTDTVRIVDRHSMLTEDAFSGVLRVNMTQLGKSPVIGGEGDVLKSVQLLPGIQGGQEATANIFVRGGTPDQNLILLDEMPVYNVNHLFGFFSLFSPEAIKSVEVFKGGFPARFGGRLSSYIDIRTREGNLYKWSATGHAGLFASSLHLGGPIIKQKASVFFSARRTYLDVITRPIYYALLKEEGIKGNVGYFFHDFIAKAQWLPSEKDQLHLSVYGGKDKAFARLRQLEAAADELAQKSKASLVWGNLTTSLRHNHVFSPQLFSHTTLGFTQYRLATQTRLEEPLSNGELAILQAGHYSQVRDLILKSRLEYHPHASHHIQLGLGQSVKWFTPEGHSFSSGTAADTSNALPGSLRIYSSLSHLYLEDDMELNQAMRLYAGIRAEYWKAQEASGFYLQPRFSFRVKLGANSAFKGAYSVVRQYLHLLSQSSAGLPTDLWLPATSRVPPARSQQVSGGFYHQLPKGNWELSMEAYYKLMQGVIEYKEGAVVDPAFVGWEDQVTAGRGKSWGVEWLLQKKGGRLNGWLAYDLSWNKRVFTELNGGNPFPFRYDRRHNLSIVLIREKDAVKSWSVSWMYRGGDRITLPLEQYQPAAGLVNETPYFGLANLSGGLPLSRLLGHAESRNNFRMRDFHKLDVVWHRKATTKRGHIRTFSFGVYNAYFRRNPFVMVVSHSQEVQPDGSTMPVVTVKEVSYFNFMPYFNYKLEF